MSIDWIFLWVTAPEDIGPVDESNRRKSADEASDVPVWRVGR